jgi:hypothetical protein
VLKNEMYLLRTTYRTWRNVVGWLLVVSGVNSDIPHTGSYNEPNIGKGVDLGNRNITENDLNELHTVIGKMAMPWLKASHHKGPSLCPGQSMWDLW